MPTLRRLLVVLTAAAGLLAGPAGAQERDLGSLLTRALSVPHVRLASSGAAVVDLTTGQLVYAHNASLPLAPASNEKLLVTYAALTELGPSFRFETDVLADGAQTDGVLDGDLVLEGCGDPRLSSFDLRVLASRVRAAGIVRVAGSIVGDETWFDRRRTAPGWKRSFYIHESPPLSALVVDRARYGRFTSRAPALAAALLFRSALRRAGVAVNGGAAVGAASSGAETVASIESPPLGTILRRMDLVSDNFTAELLLKELGAVDAGEGTTAAGAATVRGLLAQAGVPLDGVRIVDGSGLSLLDRLTPQALVTLLATMWSDPDLQPELLRALPVAGVSGTLADRMRRTAARGRVRAKTGTTSIASALSGYANDRYAFSVLENGRPLPYSWARVAQDRFATILASLGGA